MFTLLMLSAAFASSPESDPAEAALREVHPPAALAQQPQEETLQGTLIFEARVPAQIVMGGQVVGQLFTAGRLEVTAPVGRQALAIVREGKPEEIEITVPGEGAALVLIGRTGTTVTDPEPEAQEAPNPDAPAEIEVRVRANESLQLRLGASRYELNSGEVVKVALPRGKHPISVRNVRGTVIWAQGTLNVRGDHVVLQLSEGRMPEITGDASLISDAR